MSNPNPVQTLTLKQPIRFGSETIDKLAFREPKAKDFRGVSASADGSMLIGDMLNLAARLCEQPPSVIDELSVADMQEVLSVVGKFMAGGQPTGQTR